MKCDTTTKNKNFKKVLLIQKYVVYLQSNLIIRQVLSCGVAVAHDILAVRAEVRILSRQQNQFFENNAEVMEWQTWGTLARLRKNLSAPEETLDVEPP